MSELIVITAAISTDLTTIDAVKSYSDIQTDDNEQIAKAITSNSAKIGRFVDRRLARETVEQEFGEDHHHCHRHVPILLTSYPVVTIVSVTENGITLVDGTDYRVEKKSGLLHRRCEGRNVHWRRGPVVVRYTAGFWLPGDPNYVAGDDASLPANIEEACLIACRASASNRVRDPMVKSQDIEIPGVQIKRTELWAGSDPTIGTSGLPELAEEILRDFRRQGRS